MRLALAVLVALNVTLCYLTVHELSDHDCTGEDCPICQVIATMSTHAGEQAGLVLPAIQTASAIAFFSAPVLLALGVVRTESPVSLKVRLEV